MKKILGLATAALLATACGPDFQAGVPSKEMVEVQAPGGNAQALMSSEVGSAKNALSGQGNRADSYVLTRGATSGVNGGTVFVLTLLGAITDHQPTSRDGNTAVWGPYTDSLSPNTWKLTVTHQGGQSYSYALEGKAKDAPDSAFVTVLSGTHNAVSRKVGHGEFLLDWDAAATLPEHDTNIGSALITYGNDGQNGAVAVTARFEGVLDQDTGLRVNANYAYAAVPAVGGAFEFGIRKNANPQDGTTLENFTIKSRWLTSGAGRADAQVSGGDLGANQATWNECWNTDFNSTFLAVSFDPSVGYGTEATDCAIQGAEYSSL